MDEEIKKAIIELAKISSLLVKCDNEISNNQQKNNIETLNTIKNENQYIKFLERKCIDLIMKDFKNEINEEIKEIETNYQFSSQEIDKMPKKFKELFKKGKIKASIRKKENGSYEIRCQINYINISVCSKLLEKAKIKFINKLKTINNEPTKKSKKIYFMQYMNSWLENVKKPYIKENTLNEYIFTCKKYIYPVFEKKELNTIKQMEIQLLINKYVEQEKYKTANKIYQLLSAIFEYALIDELIKTSPMKKIIKPKYEKQTGTALNREEEKELINILYTNNTLTTQAYCFIIYTGLRRSELKTIEVSNEWIKVITAKQRKGTKQKTREIPISPMLKKIIHLIDIEKIKTLKDDVLTKEFKEIFNNHHLHELRHTFITRCQECGIQRELVSLWAGHNADSSMTSLVYTHLEQNKKHQIEEMQKYTYDL